MVKIPGMLMIGSASRGGGKTGFACSLINKFSSQCEIIGIKVTTIHDTAGGCPHGQSGCGVCTSLEGHYYITEETDNKADKDTCKMLAAGATRVFWIKALKTHLEEAATALLNIIGEDTVSVCESNSLRSVVEPDLFIMTESFPEKRKASAEAVSQYADRIVFFDGNKFDIDADDIKLVNRQWIVRMKATAIVMAGGASKRMGQDKSLLSVGDRPMIKYIIDRLQPNFNEIIISANDIEKYASLGVKIVSDEIADKGPLGGIASALKASANELNFVTACDIPEIDIALVRQMLRQGRDVDAVVPKTGSSRYEPLFAVYNKNALPSLEAALSSGNNRIIDALNQCTVRYIELADAQAIKNINTMDEYMEFVKSCTKTTGRGS